MRILKEKREFKSSLEELLKNVMDDVKGIKAAQISADTGQALASVLPSSVDDMRFAAVTAALSINITCGRRSSTHCFYYQ